LSAIILYLDVTFSGSPDVQTVVSPAVILTQRTSIFVQVVSYDRFIQIDLATDNDPYSILGFPLGPYMTRRVLYRKNIR